MKSKHYFDQVYEVTRNIPFGRVTTYGAIADFLALGSARMVGWALFQSSEIADGLPAHRVVNHRGELTGRNHFATPTIMEELLISEGIIIKNHRVQDFNKLFWHPEEMM